MVPADIVEVRRARLGKLAQYRACFASTTRGWTRRCESRARDRAQTDRREAAASSVECLDWLPATPTKMITVVGWSLVWASQREIDFERRSDKVTAGLGQLELDDLFRDGFSRQIQPRLLGVDTRHDARRVVEAVARQYAQVEIGRAHV